MSEQVKIRQKSPGAEDVSLLPEAVPCEKIQEVLFDYMSRELGDKQSWLVHEHLRHCATCRKAAAELEETVALLRKDAAGQPPEHLSKGIRRKLEILFLHPVLDWIYEHRHLVAAVISILIIGLLALAAVRMTRPKPEGRLFWIHSVGGGPSQPQQ